VEVEIHGDDITSVNVRVRRLVDYPVTALVPVGSFFVSANSSAQNMVATAESRVTLSNSDWRTVSVSAACANRPRDIPDSGDRFTVLRSPQQQELAALMPVLNKANANTATRQAAVWIVTDNADYGDMGILVSSPGNARVIGSEDAARAMKICSEAGIDITKKRVWRDRATILNNLKDGALKTWLQTFGEPKADAKPAPATPTTAAAKSKPVKIRYMESVSGDKIIPDTTLYLVYYDPVAAAWVEKSAGSGKTGMAEFNVPLNGEGATYSFFYAFSQEDLKEKKALAEKDQLRLFRMPPGDEDAYLEIWIDPKGMLSNKTGAIQMWGRR